MHARALESKDRGEALRTYRELVNRHPEFAETHYRLARLLEESGAWDEARDHYVLARELDGMPLRCPELLRKVYREVAAGHPAVVLVDGPKVLEAKSRHGLIGDQFFHDAQHPNLHGYAALAEDLLKQLGARRAFSWPADQPVPAVDPESCARHFKIGPEQWAQIASRDVWFYRAAAFIRYDPQFRNERASEYLRAAAEIRAGRVPGRRRSAGLGHGAEASRVAHDSRDANVRAVAAIVAETSSVCAACDDRSAADGVRRGCRRRYVARPDEVGDGVGR